jgi:hypothetical protein
VITHRKGGAFPIILQQLRTSIEVAIVRGYTTHNLRRLHHVIGAAEERANMYMIDHSNY